MARHKIGEDTVSDTVISPPPVPVSTKPDSIIAFMAVLEEKIKNSYEVSLDLSEAEKLASEFLYAHMVLTREYQRVSLDARMRKAGLKSIKASVYLAEAGQGEKKRSDVLLNALVDVSAIVATSQEAFDTSETTAELIQGWINVVQQGHIHFRQMSKGSSL